MNNPSSASERLANATVDAATADALAGGAGLPISPLPAPSSVIDMSESAGSLVAAKKQAFQRLARHLDLLESTPPTPNGMRRLTDQVLASLSTQLAKIVSPNAVVQPASKAPGGLQ